MKNVYATHPNLLSAAEPQAAPAPELSVVIPAHDEADNLGTLLAEIDAALTDCCRFEVIVVDDASRDGTPAVLAAWRSSGGDRRVLRHRSQSGQSTALRSGVRAARGRWIATLDADGQNDPADLPRMWQQLQEQGVDELKLLQGWRTTRRDTSIKCLSSRIANAVRRRILTDDTPDSGCGIRLIERAVMLELPYFNHMHRFIPALVRQAGWQVRTVPVGHRPRQAGTSHYGTWGRLRAGIVDLAGVAWLGRRNRHTASEELP